MNDVDYILNYWHYADTEEDTLLSYISDKQSDLSDDLQDILDHFRSIQLSGNISRNEVERLHRKINTWQKAGYDVGEFNLIMRDLDSRTRISGNEALLAFLMAAFIGFYQPIMAQDKKILLNISQNAYKREFQNAQQITGKGKENPPTAQDVDKWLDNTIPTGGRYQDDLYADARYRAGQFQKMVNAEKQQMNAPTPLGPKKALDIDNLQYKKALKAQRDWMLRRSQHGANKDNHAGQLDIYMSYIVSETVVRAFEDAGVEKYQFIATIDDRTTDACRSLHLKIFPMKDIMIGINCPPIYPPYHPCRSIIWAVE
ncbi:MAG TPA: minor capsid protein [Caproicibacter sp.]|nr:minor capsid protein [Caproicibacter sp.]